MEVYRKASRSIFSIVNMIIFKSDLDLYLSESDWCRFVVRFWLSNLNQKHSEPVFVRMRFKRIPLEKSSREQ